ncbi:ead/Ea22-like family protein [Chromobacterium haemolyticum]|uniref:Uncharacterized protein n=1 Tax=Chromobacterium haemolyticum TaxID=394935 RepID=A0A1W0CN16_9NEIS|nr:ead/Ea22-like family protein [Chromobacterium haemolyticum]OQS36116.1 hypothetical protein B0T45_16675 [Chromobacterium haemolyticum]
MITKEQLTELHVAAEAAHRPGVFWYQQDMLERFTRHFTGAELDATYIAAANPAMVLALMADNEAKAVRIAELEQDAARFRWLRDYWHGFEHYRKAKGTIADLPREIDEQIQKQQPAHCAEKPRCTCPSGDGSLRWPCPRHPPSIPK